MKYTLKITINLPIEKVIEKFDSLENMKHWQKGFIGYETISGIAGQTGAKSRLKYCMGKREVEMIETITHKNLPAAFHGTYEAKGVFNTQENYFVKIDEGATEWTSVSAFRFTGVTMKILGFLMPGAFKKQSYAFMKDFKNFAENGVSVAIS